MSIRTERVAGVIRETITEVLACGSVKDPRVQDGALITVTHVRVAADLGIAWVLVTSVGGAGVEHTVAGLRAAAGYLRGEVGKRLHARRLPELRFEADVAAEKEARVEAAFREIEMDRLAAAPPASEAPGPDAPESGADDGGSPAPAGDDSAVPEETAFEDTERVEVPYPASIEPRPSSK
jgi:ribosome-binding factor A